MSPRWLLFSTLTAFSVTIAIIIGQRLSSDALAILLGVAIGVAVSLPSQYFLFRLATRLPLSTPTILHPPPASPANSPLPLPRQFKFIDSESDKVLIARVID